MSFCGRGSARFSDFRCSDADTFSKNLQSCDDPCSLDAKSFGGCQIFWCISTHHEKKKSTHDPPACVETSHLSEPSCTNQALEVLVAVYPVEYCQTDSANAGSAETALEPRSVPAVSLDARPRKRDCCKQQCRHRSTHLSRCLPIK